jgi:hypothetical protein
VGDCVINEIDVVKNVYKCAEKNIYGIKSTVSSVLPHVGILCLHIRQ